MQKSIPMKLGGLALLLLTALASSGAACAQKRAQPQASAAPALPPVAANEPATQAEAQEKRPRFGNSTVYIDGKSVGVLSSTELPVALKPRVIKFEDGTQALHYGILDYLRALSVDTKQVKAVHLYGGRRVVAFNQSDLAEQGEKLVFSFTDVTRGKTRMHFPRVKMPKGNKTIDMLSNVTVYLTKEPPTFNEERELIMPDGSKVGEKVPYAPEEQGSGTRIYVDGALVGTVKRKKITNDIIVAPPSSTGNDDLLGAKTTLPANAAPDTLDRFSLLGYSAKFKAEAAQLKSVDIVAGDDVIAHLTASEARSLTFNVPARNRGQAVVYLPTKAGGLERARVSAVQYYVNSTPPARPVVAIADAPGAEIGSGRGGPEPTDEL